MAVTDQQKLDFLLKKIGYTKTKTGSVVGTGAISGTGKQPFAEAIPSPLVVPNSSLWNEAGSIPTTPPGSDTAQVKVYLAASSGLRMTADSTSSGQRAYIAYSTYNNTSSARLTNWIDTQFGSAYLIKVYKGDPNSGGVALSAAGSGSNDGWFFDYSAGVLNFNDTSVPSGVTDTNIYIVGYRYIGLTGAPTAGISTFSNLDLTVERNLDVGKQGGISTFRHNVQLLDDDILQLGSSQDFQIYHESSTHKSIIKETGASGLHFQGSNIVFDNSAGNKRYLNLVDGGAVSLYFNAAPGGAAKLETTNTGVSITGNSVISGNVTAVDGTFSGNVSIGGTLTYEDVTNVDSVGLLTARSGIRVTGGVIEAQAGENKIPSLYAAMGNLPSAGSYHGMFAHVHATGRGYFAHAGNWYELVNKEVNGVVGTGTETYNIGNLVSVSSTATSFNVTGVTTVVTLDVNGDLDVDGQTHLDHVNVSGASTFTSDATFNGGAYAVYVNTGSDIRFANGNWTGEYAGKIQHSSNKLYIQSGTNGTQIRRADGQSSWEWQTNGHFIPGLNSNVNIGENAKRVLNIYTDNLDVDSHTNLDNVSIAGVTTFSNTVHVGTGTTIETNGQATFSGITTHNFIRLPNYIHSTSVGKIQLGDLQGYEIFHYNNNNYLTFTRNLFIRGDATGRTIHIQPKISQNGIEIIPNGAVELYHSGTKRLETSSVGVSIPQDLDVDGHTNLDNVSIAGVTTFAANTRFNSSITAGGGTGSNGQYLKTTGSGVEWATFPSLRTSQTFTASAGQTTFSFSYTVGLVDVFVNGVKLTNSEFTATNGTSVVLAVGSFVGDIVELNNYNTVSAGGGAGGISNLVEDTTPQLGGNLDLFNKSITGTGNVNITGIISATSFKGPSGVTATFIGDGSGLTGITASGTGIIIKHDNNSVGTAGTINFGTGFDVSAISGSSVTVGVTTSQLDINKLDVSGISTFKGAVDINADIDVDGHTNLDNVSIAGVATATTFVGALTGNATGLSGNPSINITDLDVDGHTNLDNVSIAGVTTFTGAINASELSLTGTAGIKANSLNLKNAAGSATYATFSNGGAAVLKWNNTDRLETTTSGVTVTGTVAATSYTGDGSNLTGISAGSTAEVRANTLNVIGVSTFAGALDINNNVVIDGNIDLNGDIDVEGHTNLDNISVAGVSTFTGATTFQQLSSHSGGLQVGSAVTIGSLNGNATYTGIITAQKFVGDGSGLTGVTGSGTGIAIKNSGSVVGTAGTINFGTGLDVSAISGGSVTVSTATTTISSGNSKVFVNSVSSSNNNGSFEVFLQDNTSSGAGHTAFKIYQPTDGRNLAEYFSDNTTTTAEIQLKSLYSGSARHKLRFETNNSSYGGLLDFVTPLGQWNFYSTYQGVQKNVISFNYNNIGAGGMIYPTTNNAFDLGYSSYKWRELHVTNVNAGVITATTYHGDGSNLSGVAANIGITTNLSGSFTASAGSAATINTLTGYSANDLVVEYTIYIKNGSDFQSQKLLAMRDGTTIHSTQFAVMYSSSLLVQCDATISSGNILLRATPETGVSGSTTYKIKREVM